jgi:hypothetical protein
MQRIRNKLRRQVRTLAAHNYTTARAFYLRELRRSVAAATDLVLVYQMGKVGSTGVVQAVRSALPDAFIFQVHVLTPAHLAEGEETFRRAWSTRSGDPRTLWQAEYLVECLAEPHRGGRWQIITLVRDPIARNVSAFFQILDDQLRYGYRDKVAARGLPAVVDELLQIYWTDFPDHDVPLTWFDTELKDVFGIDVFASPFPKDEGYSFYENDRARVLVLKLERLRSCGPRALQEFLGAGEVRVPQRNVGRQKYYSDAYDRFLQRFAAPESYLDDMYGSRYARHFYTPEEIAAFRRRWGGIEAGAPNAAQASVSSTAPRGPERR